MNNNHNKDDTLCSNLFNIFADSVLHTQPIMIFCGILKAIIVVFSLVYSQNCKGQEKHKH